METGLIAPIEVQVELTQVCNWRCRHCYNHWRPQGKTGMSRLSLSETDLFRIAEELSANQIPSITITGGEPFSRRDSVFILLKEMREAGIRASINTNLSLVREDDIRKLADEYGDVPILFSMLAADAMEHERLAGVPPGTHARVVANAEFAIQKGLRVSLNMVLMRENLHALEDAIRLAKNIGIRTFCATKALPNAHAPDSAFLLTSEEVRWSLAELMRIEKQFDMPTDILGCYPRCLFADTDAYRRFSYRACAAGFTTATIGTDGSVRPCSHIEMSYGNVFREPFSVIWKRMSGWRKNEFIPEKCRDCSIVVACRGGCRVNTREQGLRNMDMHADPARLKNVPKKKPVRPLKMKNEMHGAVMVCPEARFRSEAFGALIYKTHPLTLVTVNASAAAFLKNAKERNTSFDFPLFLRQSGANTELELASVRRLYEKLVRKKILVTSKETERM